MLGKILRTAFRCGFALVALGVLTLAALRAYGQHRYDRARVAFVERVGPLEVAHYQPPVFMDSYWLTDGIYAVDMGRQANTVRYLLGLPDEAWRPGAIRRLERLLERNGAALGVLHAAAGRRLSIGLEVENAVLPGSFDFRAFRNATLLLHAEGRLFLVTGRVGEAGSSALALGSLTGALQREPLLDGQLAGSSVEASYLDLVRRLLPVAGPETLSSLHAQLTGLEPALPALRRSLGAEASAAVGSLGDFDDATPWRPGLEPGPLGRLAYRWTQELQLAAVLERYARLVAVTERPFAGLARGLTRSGRFGGAGPWLLADLVVPDLAGLIERIQATASARQLAAVAVDLRLSAFEHGAYPPSLPAGTIRSPYTAEAVGYVRAPDGSVCLTYAEAEQRWRQTGGRARPLVLHWTLPPPYGTATQAARSPDSKPSAKMKEPAIAIDTSSVP